MQVHHFSKSVSDYGKETLRASGLFGSNSFYSNPGVPETTAQGITTYDLVSKYGIKVST